ncbi:MAG: VWA domain-containing protein [Mariprofundaceae bacterium]
MNFFEEGAITFLLPWVFALLPLPWLIRKLLPSTHEQQPTAFLPFASDFSSEEVRKQPNGRPFHLWIATMIWLLTITAAAQPEWQGDAVELPISGRDLMLAVDISGSMKMEDFELAGQSVDRLTATKAVANAFIERREGDRVGLILFGSQAYVQTPLTFDRATVQVLLNESAIGLAGKETAIGDAIGLAVKRLGSSPSNTEMTDQVLILLTDGVNTAGEVPPDQAAMLAARRGLTIYTIGIGADKMLVSSFFGQRQINPSAQLDEAALTEIAEKTGGRYFRARDSQELASIYRIIDELEPVEREKELFRPRHSLFTWPLAVALLLAALLVTGIRFQKRK